MEGCFRDRVFAVVRGIPPGSVLSYGDVARLAGNPRAARAAGSVLKTNYDLGVPCHRVICADGRLGEYNRGAEKKRALLAEEGFLAQ